MKRMIDLFEHQKEALELTKNFNKVAYYYDMGLGKTFIGSEKLKAFNTNHNLIICQLSKVDDWIEHFQTHYDYNTYNLRDKTEQKEFIQNGGVGVINYEMFWRRNIQISDYTLMLDESSLIQNEKSKQTKAILKLEPKNVILLSGTPTGGKYEKLWTQAYLLGWNIKQKTYNTQFLVYEKINIGNGEKRNTISGYKNTDRLKNKFRSHGAVFKKTEEVFNLPEQIHIDKKIKSTEEYMKFKKDRVIKLEDKKLIGDTTLTKMMYERMLASQYNPNKIEACKDLIHSTDGRLIIFYNFVEELEILKTLSDRPISQINGEVKDLTNYNNFDNSITLVQYQSGSMGHNLQKSNKIIYFSPPLMSELFEQSKKRTHRIGQDRTCFYYYLITKNTIEEKIYDTLKLRKNYTNELFEEEENGE